MLFNEEEKSLKFFEFEFELMRHPCYFKKKSKSLKVSEFEVRFELISHVCYFRKNRKV